MSAQIISAHELQAEEKLSVSFRLLLSLYAIIPVCFLLQLLDVYFWHGGLQEKLPNSPTQFLLFQIIFGTPHIVASNILLVSNGEYLKFYQKKIIWMTLGLAVFFGLGSLFIPYRVLYVAVACWTVYHVLKQQLGVARGVCSLSSRSFYILLWLSVTAGIFIYIGIFLKNVLDIQQTHWVQQISAVLCIALFLAALVYQRSASSFFGKWFLWANVLLVLGSYYFYIQQYYFFAILMPRLVHDATAYIFYVTHDYNKHHQHPQNALYRYAARCNIHTFIVLPVCSLFLAFVLQSYGDIAVNFITNVLFSINAGKVITVGLLGYLALMHYYTEAFTWKFNSPYRQFIGFSK